MNSKNIAAIEIGSSRIKGIVAAVESDGRLKVLAVEEAPSGDSVRFGRIQNAREASDIINDIIRRLENAPQVVPGQITSTFIADGGRSLRSASTDASINIGGDEEITSRILDRLHREARYNLSTDRDILAIAPRRYFVDTQEVKKVVGTFGSNVRGEFTAITQANENRRALDRLIIESHGEDVERDYVTRLLAQTELALSESERQVGVVFVDFGAESTSVAAFRGGSLVFAVTLPIGSANITRDLSTGLSITFANAEHIKRTKGEAVMDRTTFDAPDDEIREIVDYVSARSGEIIANVVNILEQAGFRTTDFPDGIVITGGGSYLRGFPEMVESITKMKVRRATVDPSIASAVAGIDLTANFDVIALAKYAAAHSGIDCITFVETPDTPEAPHDSVKTHAPQAAAEPKKDAAIKNERRKPMEDDDPRLLEDDVFEQPVNINQDDITDDLPEPGTDAKTTRMKLMDRINAIVAGAKSLVKSPIEDGGMDN